MTGTRFGRNRSDFKLAGQAATCGICKAAKVLKSPWHHGFDLSMRALPGETEPNSADGEHGEPGELPVLSGFRPGRSSDSSGDGLGFHAAGFRAGDLGRWLDPGSFDLIGDGFVD